MFKSTQIIGWLFITYLISVILFFVFRTGVTRSLVLYLPAILIVVHSLGNLRWKGPVLLLLASVVGFTFEYFDLKYGTTFGGEYRYLMGGRYFLTVPLNVILYWSVFIYTGYCLTNSFLYWKNKEKPRKGNGLKELIFIILIDGFLVVAIDLFMDPIEVANGSWIWTGGGPYFGIPVGNFIGWFLVTIISTGFFRAWEYFAPIETNWSWKKTNVIATLSYALIYISFVSTSIKLGLGALSIVGSMAMLPTIVVNIVMYLQAGFDSTSEKSAPTVSKITV